MKRLALLAPGMLWVLGTGVVFAQGQTAFKAPARIQLSDLNATNNVDAAKPAETAPSVPADTGVLPAGCAPAHQGKMLPPTDEIAKPAGLAKPVQPPVLADVVTTAAVDDVIFMTNDQPAWGRFSVGTGVYLLWPRFSSNPAFTHNVGNVTSQESFHYGARVAPLVWAAFEGANGWGARVRWFEFDQSADAFDFAHPGGGAVYSSARPLGATPVVATDAGDRVFFGSGLDIDVWDFDFTWSPQLGPDWSLQFGMGVTYRYISQDYSAYGGGEYYVPPQLQTITIYSTSYTSSSGGGKPPWIRPNHPHGGPPGLLRGHPHGGPPGLMRKQNQPQPQPLTTATTITIPVTPGQEIYAGYGVESVRTFNGGGPTFSFDVTRNLGTTGLYVYSEGRFSILFGSTEQTVVERSYLDGKVVDQHTILSRNQDVIPVGELELGLGLRRELGRGVLMFRAGLVGQAWWGAGNATSDGGDLGFLGGVFRGGIQF